MNSRTWLILGATSIIAERFAHLVAKEGHNLRLVARDQRQLEIIAHDIRLRYQVLCELFPCNLALPMNPNDFFAGAQEIDLFIAHSDFTENPKLTQETITHLINTNVLATSLIVHHYLQLQQSQHHLLYLSSVAACRGRAKNSLYGASKAAIEVFLQGLQQTATRNQTISIVKLGFIDTKQTYGNPGVFYAAKPKACAKACHRALQQKKPLIYYPGFWKVIMWVITSLPFFLYRRLKRM